MKVILEMTGGPLRDGEVILLNYLLGELLVVVTRTYEGVSHVKTLEVSS